MSTIVVSAVILLVLAMAVAAGCFLRRKKPDVFADMGTAISVLPAQELDLKPSTLERWQLQEQIQALAEELVQINARNLGYFEVRHGYALIQISLWNYKQQAIIAIYEASTTVQPDSAHLFFEVACKTNSGSLCISTNANAANTSRPENHKLIHHSSNSVKELLKQLKTQLGQEQKAVRITDGKLFFNECYEDTTEWAWMPEQIKSQQTKQTLEIVGIAVTDELIEELLELGRLYQVEVNTRRALRRLASGLRNQANIPESISTSVANLESLTDRLVVIHEKMDAVHIIDAIYDLTESLSDNQEKVIEGFQINNPTISDPISAFHLLLQATNLQPKRIATLHKPVRSEIFLKLH